MRARPTSSSAGPITRPGSDPSRSSLSHPSNPSNLSTLALSDLSLSLLSLRPPTVCATGERCLTASAGC